MYDIIGSWTEVMTAFIDFVEGRRKGFEPVILVAHNARRFDVPFIMKESRACSIDVPSHWYFVDTIDLAKTMLKKRFGTCIAYLPIPVGLFALFNATSSRDSKQKPLWSSFLVKLP